MKRLILTLSVLLLVASGFAQTASQRYVESFMADPDFAAAQVGILAVTVSGDTLAAYFPDGKLMPASNAKLITTGLALSTLGADYKYTTKIGYSGKVMDGTLHGDLYIIGGGDPTIGSKDSIAVSAQSLFARWKSFLVKEGISRIDGHIVGDGRCYGGQAESPDWLYEDLGTYYGTGGDGLSFYRNIKDFLVTPGTSQGKPLSVKEGYPSTPWMSYSYDCTTGAAGTGDQIYLYTTSLAPFGVLRGTFAADRAAKTMKCSNKFGAYTCASEFRTWLRAGGIPVSGSPADIVMMSGASAGTGKPMLRESPEEWTEDLDIPAAEANSLTVIGSTESPALSRIAYVTNQRSDNFYAEAMFREMGKKLSGSDLADDCWEAEKQALLSLGVDPVRRIRLYDGSGLARKDVVSPSLFVDFLGAMLKSPAAQPFVRSLTTPGQGSQAGRMRNEPASARSRIAYKSGSMEGVRCYSGYIAPSGSTPAAIKKGAAVAGSTVVFSVMVNSYTGPEWKLTSRIDHLLGLLASER